MYSCKNNYCEADVDGLYSELKCSGEDCESVHVLTCEFHKLAYAIECTQRAKDAEKVIDPELVKGHSNLPESAFSFLTKFRAKDTVTKNCCVTHVKIREYANLVSSLLRFSNSILSRFRMLLQIVCYCNIIFFSIAGKF